MRRDVANFPLDALSNPHSDDPGLSGSSCERARSNKTAQIRERISVVVGRRETGNQNIFWDQLRTIKSAEETRERDIFYVKEHVTNARPRSPDEGLRKESILVLVEGSKCRLSESLFFFYFFLSSSKPLNESILSGSERDDGDQSRFVSAIVRNNLRTERAHSLSGRIPLSSYRRHSLASTRVCYTRSTRVWCIS